MAFCYHNAQFSELCSYSLTNFGLLLFLAGWSISVYAANYSLDFDGTNIKLYVNGTLARTLAASAASNASEILRIGVHHLVHSRY